MSQNLVSNEEPTFALLHLVVVLYYDVQCVHGNEFGSSFCPDQTSSFLTVSPSHSETNASFHRSLSVSHTHRAYQHVGHESCSLAGRLSIGTTPLFVFCLCHALFIFFLSFLVLLPPTIVHLLMKFCVAN